MHTHIRTHTHIHTYTHTFQVLDAVDNGSNPDLFLGHLLRGTVAANDAARGRVVSACMLGNALSCDSAYSDKS
jgi:hypothetical protein